MADVKCPNSVVLAGRRIELQNCVPRNKEEWSLELAKLLADINGIKFTDTVKRVVEYVRKFWQQYEVCPPASVMEADLGIDRKTLLDAFGGSYSAICALAGVEPPSGCLSQVLSST
jgi:Dissimilatory sulfite reductase (desulfoviridin), gamma subunit